MIFVTVGTQLPFPRLIDAMDGWCANNPGNTVIAQTGEQSAAPSHLETRKHLDAIAFRDMVENCEMLVAHAGMGSILTALDLGKPVIIMPRQARLGEHRNDHQRATAEKFGHIANLRVVNTDEELGSAIEAFRRERVASSRDVQISVQSRQLIDEVRSFVLGDLTWSVPEAANLPGIPGAQPI